MRTSSGSDSGFTADRAIGSARSSVASSPDRSFKDCVRLASLADDANGALSLRVPGYGAGGPCGLVLLPAPESGPPASPLSSPFQPLAGALSPGGRAARLS